MIDFMRALLLPPGINLVLLVLGLLLLPLARKLAVWLLLLGVLFLYLLSIAPVAGFLISRVESVAALKDPVQVDTEKAIVVLGAGRYHDAPEYAVRDTSGHLALMRLRYAAHIQKQTGLPILATGGRPNGELYSEAELMDQTLKSSFNSLARWTEQSSRNTFENAICSKFILDGQGIQRVFLVTHAVHMPRARYVFEKAGLQITPAPTGFLKDSFKNLKTTETWLPSMEALQVSRTALHEWAGLLYYKMIYGDINSAAGTKASC